MYLHYYNLREKPFSLTPDPAFLYYSSAHKRAMAFLTYGLQEGKGFIQLTGPVGSGKTTLLRAILGQLDERAKTAYIINPSAPFPDLLRSIMKDLEIPNIPNTRLKMELLDFFHDYLLAQMKRSNPVVVIVDEAQNLSLENMEEIRMLSNFETATQKLVQIVFVGQPELVEKFDLPELRQLKQRVQVRYHLPPLSLLECREYIQHRLRVAGSDGGITFTGDAYEAIFEFSDGIPRLINSVCDVILLIGYVNETKRFDRLNVEEAIRELSGVFDDESDAADSGNGPLETSGNGDTDDGNHERGSSEDVDTILSSENLPADDAHVPPSNGEEELLESIQSAAVDAEDDFEGESSEIVSDAVRSDAAHGEPEPYRQSRPQKAPVTSTHVSDGCDTVRHRPHRHSSDAPQGGRTHTYGRTLLRGNLKHNRRQRVNWDLGLY